MSQLLALQWNDREARAAVASMRGSRVVVEHAFSIPLVPPEQGTNGAEAGPGQQIAAALNSRGIGRPDALVAVGRTNLELRQLLLPAAPDDELPEMVRFQAMREFNELDEAWALDFVPIDQSADGQRTVLAAAMSPQRVQQIQEVCQGAGLKPRRVGLRACAAASLVARGMADRPGELRLLVDLLEDEADLTVMLDRKVVFLRTTRLGADPCDWQALLGEIRRTMAAVQNQLGGRKVESVVLCGQGTPYTELARRIKDELGSPAELFDPFEGLEVGGTLRDAPPEHPGRFASLLGMLTAELEQTGHAIDFLHPRRRPAPPSRRRIAIAAGAAVAALLLAWFAYARIDHFLLVRELARLKAEAESLKDATDKADKIRAVSADLARWVDHDVVWLDQFRDLSEDFVPAQTACSGNSPSK